MNKAAYEALCRERMQGLYRIALSILRNPGDARDAVQQAQKNIWIGEDGKVHQLIEANMVGYQDALLDEESRMTVSLKRLVEYPLDPYVQDKYYDVADGRFLVYFDQTEQSIRTARHAGRFLFGRIKKGEMKQINQREG